MVALEKQDVTIEAGGNLQAMMNQAQYERMETAARWSQRQEFARGREVEDVKEDLVSIVSPCVRWLECCATRNHDQETYFVWQSEDTLSTIFAVCHHGVSDALDDALIRKRRLLGSSLEAR